MMTKTTTKTTKLTMMMTATTMTKMSIRKTATPLVNYKTILYEFGPPNFSKCRQEELGQFGNFLHLIFHDLHFLGTIDGCGRKKSAFL